MKLPEDKIIKKVEWINRYFVRLEKLLDNKHKKWLDIAKKNYDDPIQYELKELLNRIHKKRQIMVRYSSIITSKALIQMSK